MSTGRCETAVWSATLAAVATPTPGTAGWAVSPKRVRSSSAPPRDSKVRTVAGWPPGFRTDRPPSGACCVCGGILLPPVALSDHTHRSGCVVGAGRAGARSAGDDESAGRSVPGGWPTSGGRALHRVDRFGVIGGCYADHMATGSWVRAELATRLISRTHRQCAAGPAALSGLPLDRFAGPSPPLPRNAHEPAARWSPVGGIGRRGPEDGMAGRPGRRCNYA